jgi:hypothetical protein
LENQVQAMNKKQNSQRAVILSARGFNNTGAGEVIVPFKRTIIAEDNRTIRMPEIITPRPYSVFALCRTYEQFQRN